MSRVLLLNPPGTRNYIRDYFCSKLAKSNYQSPPVVLLMLSGILSQAHELEVLDAIVEHLNVPQSLQRIRRFQPEVIVTLVGAASWEEDRNFFKQLKPEFAGLLIANGDVLLEDTEIRLDEAPEIDAVLFHFIAEDILAYLRQPGEKHISNMVVRKKMGPGYFRGEYKPYAGEYHIPRPQHELFPLYRYRFPFMLSRPMTAMLTDYGCPFCCRFCVIPGLGFGLRPVADVLEEMAALAASGVREIFFLDQTFGSRKARTMALCRSMAEQHFDFQWSCFSRADVLDRELLCQMRNSGCHTIIFGVESGNEKTLVAYHKKMQRERIRASLQLCRELKIRIGATFILGLPGETEQEARQTIALALELPLDFAAFNVAIPRAGTPLRAMAIQAGLIDRTLLSMDQSGLESAIGTRELSAARVLQLRQQALRAFYLRPGYWLRRLFTIRSIWDLWSQLSAGVGVVVDALGWKKN